MLKISDLQSQVALNRQVLGKLENDLYFEKYLIKNVNFRSFFSDNHKEQFIEESKIRVKHLKKKINRYAKLQRALKDEIAYRIRFDRVMRELKVWEEQAKAEGFEIVAEDKCTLP